MGKVGVGGGWDVKELIFRDFGCVNNVLDELHLSVMWHDVKQEFYVTALLVDPSYDVVTGVDLRGCFFGMEKKFKKK